MRASESSLRVSGGAQLTMVKLVSAGQRSSRVPALSLAQGLFALNIPFGVKCITVPICASRLLGKLYGSKKETLPSISAVFQNLEITKY